MSPPAPIPPPPPDMRPPSPERALRRLFLALFLRGRSSRGLQRDKTPKSIQSKLLTMLLIYAVVGGAISMNFLGKPIFATSLYLQSMTLVFLGMFVAASAGEVLFNKDEADILMHRPVTPRAMLWAKISVLLQISLWLVGALNLGGFIVGTFSASPGWLFPIVHAFSITCEALFCTGGVVLTYQLCLRWFGREKMDGLMTTAQVVVAVGAVFLGQLGPQLMRRSGLKMEVPDEWWIGLLPPAWFAGMDDALAGSGNRYSWILAGVGLVATAGVLGLAFGKLARTYELGLQSMNEAAPAPRSSGGRSRFVETLLRLPPLRWWIRDSVSRASFVLTASYLLRDRDVKLRVYPGIAPMLAMPVIFLLNETHLGYASARNDPGMFAGFAVAFAGAYIGFIPFLALKILRFSQQWQAADLFRVAPINGPAPLCDGARRAVLCFIALPMLVLFGGIVWLIGRGSAHLGLFIPGLMILPIYALVPCIRGKAVPLSLPVEGGKAAGRVASMYAVMAISGVLAGAATLAFNRGWFTWFLIGEAIVAIGIYTAIRVSLPGTPWASLDGAPRLFSTPES